MVCLISENGKVKRPGKATRRSNGGPRPNVYQRASNKRYLLSPESGFGGNGTTVPCAHCGKPLDFTTIHADRAKPGSKGGDYKQSNLVPSCGPCNLRRGDKSLWSYNPNLARKLVRRNRKATS